MMSRTHTPRLAVVRTLSAAVTSTLTATVAATLAATATLAGPVAAAAPSSPSPLAPTLQPQQAEAWLGAVSANDVRVLAGPFEAFYATHTLQRGDVVRIIGTSDDGELLQVELRGPAFRKAFGYIRVPKGDDGRLRLEDGGSRARTLARVDLHAPNMDTDYAPRDSWRRIHQIPPDVVLEVRKVVEAERDVYYAVTPPAGAAAWVSKRFVGQATPQQQEAWQAALAAPGTPESAIAGTDSAATQADPAPGQLDPSRAGVLAREEDTVTLPAEPSVAETGPIADDIGLLADGSETVGSEDTASESAGAELEAPAKTDEERLADLEEFYAELKQEPIETAEVMPLLELFSELAAEADGGVQRYASKRATQLEIWAELQQNRLDVLDLRKRIDMTSDEAVQARIFADTTGDYTAVGRLAASTIYDGQRLPLLYRLQDPATRRTIAYVQVGPDGTSANGIDLTSMLGQLVGVIGDRTWDERLKLNRLDPRRLDLLSASGQ